MGGWGGKMVSGPTFESGISSATCSRWGNLAKTYPQMKIHWQKVVNEQTIGFQYIWT